MPTIKEATKESILKEIDYYQKLIKQANNLKRRIKTEKMLFYLDPGIIYIIEFYIGRKRAAIRKWERICST